MLDSGVIDVAIGVVFVYLLISLLCSAIYEAIAARLRWRSKDLEKGIVSLLGGEAPRVSGPLPERVQQLVVSGIKIPWHLLTGSPNGAGQTATGVSKRLLDHPLIMSLRDQKKLPSYMPGRVFSAALLDVLNDTDSMDEITWTVQALPADQANVQAYLQALLTQPNQSFTVLSEMAASLPDAAQAEFSAAVSQANISAIRRLAVNLPAQYDSVKLHIEALLTPVDVESILTTINRLPDGTFQRQVRSVVARWGEVILDLQSLFRGVIDDAGHRRLEVERWFDSGMERVSGWYKRRAQFIIILLSIPIVAGLNADTLTMAQTLWQDETVRTALAEQGSQLVTADSTPSCFKPKTEAVDPADCTKEIRGKLSGLEILGWKNNDHKADKASQKSDPREHPIFDSLNPADIDEKGWLFKIAGLAITMGAVSQGAPFWFDILKKVVNLRGAGKPPAATAAATAPAAPAAASDSGST
jgi:hypothetical protein